MKKLSFLFLLFIFACNNEPASVDQPVTETTAQQQGLKLEMQQNDELNFEKLRIYPIVADLSFIANHKVAAGLKNLKEAIDIKGFRISEKKPYGRFNDGGAVNNLTVQNKSQDTVYLMAGDVVQGGKQDRVLAVDMVIPPRTIQDIPVFCVEAKRWEYRADSSSIGNPDLAVANDHLSEQKKKIFAFTGYYNVASNDLRKTMMRTNDQNAVWEKVGDLTALNNAESATGAYTNLENSEAFTGKRNEYIDFFAGKFDHRNDVIGMVAVSGAKVLGTDIFTHPNLFKKQYEVLMHAYVTEAMSNGKKPIMSPESIKRYGDKMFRKFDKAVAKPIDNQNQFHYKGKLIHFTDL